MKEDYSTMVEALQDFKDKGYKIDWEIDQGLLKSKDKNLKLDPKDCKVAKAYRFEGDTNPSDMSIVYAIESKNGKHKGTLVTAYGVYSEPMGDKLIQLLKMDHHS
ncbi:MAG: phosphoribosylpyrophosphate synthetase [Saprospirales bacterium]|nr:MAG: phosphoribosylpyrophosphate synthetase [Saprospirales bacterium]